MFIKDLTPSEYHPYYASFVKMIDEKTPLIHVLQESKEEVVSFFNDIPSQKLSYRYDVDKWTPKEVLVHLMDTERIFSYRALRFARKDKVDLLGFDKMILYLHPKLILDQYNLLSRSIRPLERLQLYFSRTLTIRCLRK